MTSEEISIPEGFKDIDSFNEIMEDNVQYASYKRSISRNYESITHEISASVPPNVTLQQTQDWLRKRVNYYLQQDLPMLEAGLLNRKRLKRNT